MPEKENRPAGNGAESRTTGCTQYIAGLHRRRAATYRAEPLKCSCRDPWTCKCYSDSDDTTDQYIDGYRDAAQHLLAHGLTPAPNVVAMRGLWGRGGTDRDLARTVAERWITA